ncbi:fibronectin type III domain-containing protein [Cryomorphaceae bacterium]|nr:fibronectin type III domain-containing protein [Cryomorphaceae bacterium]
MKKIYSGILSLLTILLWTTNVSAQCVSGGGAIEESFDGSSLPSGWDQSTGAENWIFSTGQGWGAGTADENTGNGGNAAWVDGSGTSTTGILISPAIDASTLANPILDFWWHSNNTNVPGDNALLIVDVYNGSTWVNVATLSGDNAAWQNATPSLAGITWTGNSHQVRFTVDFTGMTSFTYYNDISIDDIFFGEPTPCAIPSAVTVSNETATSFDLAWTEGTPGATSWEIVIEELGSGACQTISTGSNPVTINGLNPGTGYAAYVREYCGSGSDYSFYADVANAFTLCPTSFSAPYFTSFENPGDGDPCWTQDGSDDFDWSFGATTPSSSTGPSSAFDGNQFAYTESSGNSGEIGIFVSPDIDLSSVANPTVRFNYHMYGFQMGSLDLEVESPAGSGNWTLVWSEIGNQNNQWREAIVPLTPFAGQTVAFRFYGVPGGTTTSDMAVDNFSVEDEFCVTPFDVIVNPQGLFADVSWTTLNADSVALAYREAGATTWDTISGLTSSSFTIFGLDEQTSYELTITAYCSSTGGTATTQVFNFTTPIACPDPFNGSTSGVTTNSADLSWISGGSSTWDIQSGPAGFILGQGTVTSGVTSNPYTLGNLMPGTNYEWYVRDDCGANGTSDWDGPYSFTTNPVCPPGTRKVLIAINSGSFANEVTWDIRSSAGAVVASGGPYAVNNTNYAAEACLMDGEVYTFNAYDSWGDGWNGGTYSVTCESSGSILANNGGATPNNGTGGGNNFELETSENFQSDFCDCINATGMTVNSASAASVDVQWTPGGNANGPWDLVIVDAGADPNSTIPVASANGVTSTSYVFTGLTLSSNTNYDVYVAEFCTGPGAMQPFGSSASFTTPDVFLCASPVVAPVTEDFDLLTPNNAGIFSCITTDNISSGLFSNISNDDIEWTARSSSTGSSLTGPPGDLDGTGNYIFLESSSCSFNTAILVSECVDLSGLVAPSISFYYHMYGSNMGSLSLEISSASSNWTQVWTLSGDQGNSWFQAAVDLSAYAGDNVRARFIGTTGSSFRSDMALDEITFGEAPCTAPSGVTVDASTSSSVSLSWTASPAALTYDVGVWASGDDPDVDPAVATLTGVSGTTATVSGLSAQTTYDVYVTSNCSGNGTGRVQGPTFSTPCAGFTAPFAENFDGPTWGALTTFDPCWQVLPDLFDPNWQIEDGPTGSSPTGPNNDVSGPGQYAYVETSGGTAGDETYLILPVINISALSNPGIEFFYHMFGANTGTLEVQVRNAGSATWNTIWSLSGQQQTSSADAWAPASASLSGYSGDIEIQFVGIHTVGGCCTGDMAIDEVKVDNVCPAPSNVSVSNVFDTSFDVSWTGSGSNYQVEIVTSGTAPTGSGTAVSGTSYTASGLTPETSYDIYVYQDCGFGVSAGASATQATSYCPPPVAIPFSALPYNENFDALGAPRIPCGWLVDDANVDAIVWEGQDRSSLSQSNPNALEIERNTSTDMDDWIFSPEFIVPANTSLDITFSYRVRTNQYVEKLEVFVGNSQDPAGMNLKLFDVPNLQNSFYKTVTVSYTTIAAENIFIGLHGYSDADQFALYIDDFEVKEADCPTPFLLSAVATGQTSADLSWNGPGDTFIVEYGPAGFAPGTGTSVIAGGSPLSISGLEVGADYEFYVQNDCNGTGDGLSQNAGPAAFTTDCPSVTATETMSCPDGSLITLTGMPAGGVFSGPGLTGNVFDPTSVQPGTYTLNYTVTNAFGTSCPGTVDITVNPFPNVVFGDLGSYCDGQNGFTITTASPTGGVFTGPGIVGTDFVPAQIGVPGTYTLYYTYTDPATGCTAMDSASVNLIPTPNVTLNAPQTSFCGVNDSIVALNGSPAGGVFSGPGVVNGTFDPSIAGVGNHTLRYTVTSGSCATFDQLVMTVNEIPSVTASPDVTVVFGTGTQLSAVATGGSGNYTYSWSPADSILGAGIGNQVTTGPLTVDQQFVVEAIDNVTGCRGYDTVNVTIFGGPIEILLSVDKDTICVGETVQLSASVTGGSDTTYSFLWTPSSYVTDINTLNTSSSPIVTTTYSFYVDDTFSQKVEYITVYVNDLPNVQFGVVPNQCVDGGAVMLTQGSPAGGTYSGAGVTGAMFDPAAAGVGTHTLTYTYVNANGCEASATTDLIVSDIPTVTMGALADVCAADAPFALTVGAPVGGTYSGNGVSNGIFDPAAAGQGPHNILYTYTDANGCTSSASTQIIVNQASIGFHLPIPDVCTDAGAVTLTGAIPPGGTYTGPGVNGGVFYPAQVGPGTYTLDYETLSVSGCPIAFQATITVNAVPSVSTPTLANTCASAASFALSGATPAGGNWSGPGVSGGNFDPAAAGAGTHVLTYTYTSADGCPASSTSTIVVTPAPVVSLAAQGNVCADASPVLISGASPGGGVYSGPGVSGNTFDPVAAGSGTHTITYTYTNPEGCVGTATTTITVDALPNVSFSGIGDVCASAAPVAMTGSPAGGTFSGPGIVNGDTFDPTIVAPGTYTITYTYTDPATGCTNSASQQQNVNADPAAPIILQNGCDLIVQSSVTNPVYTWLDDQGNVVGSGSTITTPCVGFNVYFVEVEDPVTGCTSTSAQFVASYVSLEDELTNETIEVYPNPNRGSFELSIAQLSADNVEVAITDARGRLIMEEEVEHTNGAIFERNYNLENVENGVYFIRVTAEGHSSVKRIVIEK